MNEWRGKGGTKKRGEKKRKKKIFRGAHGASQVCAIRFASPFSSLPSFSVVCLFNIPFLCYSSPARIHLPYSLFFVSSKGKARARL